MNNISLIGRLATDVDLQGITGGSQVPPSSWLSTATPKRRTSHTPRPDFTPDNRIPGQVGEPLLSATGRPEAPGWPSLVATEGGAPSESSSGLRHFGGGNLSEVEPIPEKPPDQAAIVRS